MTYEEMIADTDKMIKDIMRQEEIWMYVWIVLSAIFLILIMIGLFQEWKYMKKKKVMNVVGGNDYTPVVTENVQVVNGVEFHQMGVPGKVPQ